MITHLAISNVAGQIIMDFNEPDLNGSFYKELQLKELSAGLYYLTVNRGNRTATFRFIRD
jgi:hypothetical protein